MHMKHSCWSGVQRAFLETFKYSYLLEIISTFVYRKCQLRVEWMFRCWVICRWRCWRQCWCERSWCYIQVTMTVMTTDVHTGVGSPTALSDGHSLCCPQCASFGIMHSVAGRSHRLVTGSVISWGRWLNVSVHSTDQSHLIIHVG